MSTRTLSSIAHTMLLALPLLASTASNQGKVTTATDYGVAVNLVSPENRWIAASQPLQLPVELKVEQNGTNSTTASVRSSIQLAGTDVKATLSVSESGSVRTFFTLATGNTIASRSSTSYARHMLRWEVPARLGKTAKVSVSYSGSGFNTSAGIDLDGDKSMDWSDFGARKSSMSFQVQATPQDTFVVHVETGAYISTVTSEQYDLSFQVTIEANDPCQLTEYGNSCEHSMSATQVLTATSRRLVVDILSRRPNLPMALVFGTQRLDIPIPGTTCRLLTDALVILPTATDNLGYKQVGFELPLRPASLQLTMQTWLLEYATYWRISTTSAWELACR